MTRRPYHRAAAALRYVRVRTYKLYRGGDQYSSLSLDLDISFQSPSCSQDTCLRYLPQEAGQLPAAVYTYIGGTMVIPAL